MIPYLEALAVVNQEKKEISLFAVSRHPREKLDLEARLSSYPDGRLLEHIVLSHPDPLAVNDRDNPTRVVPGKIKGSRIDKDTVHALLPLSTRFASVLGR